MLEITGVNELASYVGNLATTIKPQVIEMVGTVFEQGGERIIKDCPEDTGKMKKGISIKLGKGSAELARIDIPAPYAGFVNFGHKTRNGGYVKPNPFVTNNYNWMLSQFNKQQKT